MGWWRRRRRRGRSDGPLLSGASTDEAGLHALADRALEVEGVRIPVSLPVRLPPHSGALPRFGFGLAYADHERARRLLGRNGELVRTGCGTRLARLRLLAVEPESGALVAELLGLC